MTAGKDLDIAYPETKEYVRSYTDDAGDFSIRMVASANLPSRFGDFIIVGFLDSQGNREHTAMIHGNVRGAENVPIRVHSECHTGDVMGSLRCDCRDQLEAALRFVGQQVCGGVLYLRQEGRGIGLLNKIKAYRIQDQGYDTVDANLKLGLPAEARKYHAAAAMIDLLGIVSINLLTNNPAKMDALIKLGVNIRDRLPLVIPANRHSDGYLQVKRDRMNHLL